ncbi:MAG TPA: RNA-binding protein [Myxococcales bacterium]|nr:RNA-binding protein [Myxococcales bacterium]
MANKSVFQSWFGKNKNVPAASAVNEAGGVAYSLSPRQALAQMAATGCFNQTFYASAAEQLHQVTKLCAKVEAGFIARTAVYARERGAMKDMPAFLCAALSVRSPELLGKVFDRVIDDGRMLRTFVQIVRSGAAGRKSLGSRPKKLVQGWFAARSDEQVFRASVGQSPSLADVVRLSRPRPATRSREALYGWLVGRDVPKADLPELVREFEAYRAEPSGAVPDVPFQMLTALQLGVDEWTAIACQASWQTTRMNLAAFERHGVFKQSGMAYLIAKRLRDPEQIRRAKAFPYQLMAAWSAAHELPGIVRDALQDAMEIALENVPAVTGRVWVLPDVSGSMSSPVTGNRGGGGTSSMRCIDVAALFAAAMLRKNRSAGVLPFAEDVRAAELNPRDTVLTNAAKLAALGGGGTNCSAPLALLNRKRERGDLVVFISDNQSWMDNRAGGQGTATLREWAVFKARNPKAKLVCIDLQPYGTTQAADRADILNVGGFSDAVFDRVAEFANTSTGPDGWVRAIEEVQI